MQKSILIAILLFTTEITFSQTNEIVKLLNQQFKREQKMYDEYDREKPILAQAFQIKNDTLSVVISMPYEIGEEKTRIFHRSVHLKDITGFIKDMNVLFTAKDSSVKETVIRKDENGNTLRTDTSYYHLFFTELKKDPNDKSLQHKILKTFKKAGYDITSEYWYN